MDVESSSGHWKNCNIWFQVWFKKNKKKVIDHMTTLTFSNGLPAKDAFILTCGTWRNQVLKKSGAQVEYTWTGPQEPDEVRTDFPLLLFLNQVPKLRIP